MVARLILKQRKAPGDIGRDGGKEISTNSLSGVQPEQTFYSFFLCPTGDQEEKSLRGPILEATQSKLARALDANLICMLSLSITVCMQLQ